MCGLTKFSSDQSSSRVFWIGVPDNRSRFSEGSFFSSCTRRQLAFLILWPSSMMRYCQQYPCSAARSMMLTFFLASERGGGMLREDGMLRKEGMLHPI